MPNKDGTGPRGEGRRTGRQMGNCGEAKPTGRGLGPCGSGMRRGLGKRFSDNSPNEED